jgi:hypothetical protein
VADLPLQNCKAPALKPGDYVWRREVAPAGPVVILVSLPDQLLYVYRNGVRIGRSMVSTGKPGKSKRSNFAPQFGLKLKISFTAYQKIKRRASIERHS